MGSVQRDQERGKGSEMQGRAQEWCATWGVQEARVVMRLISASATCGDGREICGSRGVHVVAGCAAGRWDWDTGDGGRRTADRGRWMRDGIRGEKKTVIEN
jgi:hypothetical protein